MTAPGTSLESPAMNSIVAVDIGNSTARWGLWNGRGFEHCGSWPVADLGKTSLFAEPPASDRIGMVVASSVVPGSEDALARAIRHQLGLAVRFLGRDLKVPLQIDVEEPDRVGADRLAAAVAAHRSCSAAVVVDFGTAITVDAVTADGRFVGGAILPGPRLCLAGLAAGTAGVKLDGDVGVRLPPGRNTREAVEAALSHGLAGAVDRLTQRTRAALGDGTGAIATGGGAGFFLPLCETRFTHAPNLVLEGLVAAALDEI